jgi:hypothetical protein
MKPPSSASRNSATKTRILVSFVLVLLALLLWKGDEIAMHLKPADEARKKTAKGHGLSSGEDTAGKASLPSKVSRREPATVKPTHSPLQLKDFFLPAVEIDGLTLQAALAKLKTAYEEACRETGEVPVSLAFDLPPGKDKALHLKLGARNLDSSIRMLAAASGLMVRREGSTYHLEEAGKLAGKSERTLRVPPDLAARLAEMGGGSSSSRELRDLFMAMGIELDPSTRIEHSAGTGTLKIQTESAADLAALNGMTDQVINDLPMQQKLQTKMLEIPAGVEWMGPDLAGQYTDGQIQLMMREFAQTKGINLITLPSVTARNGETGAIEIIKELITPADDSGEHFETHNLGHVMKFSGSFLGLGQRMDVDYTYTEGGADPVTGRAQISTRADIKGTAYIGDGFTRLYVQTRPDGSSQVMMTTATRIDATGRPVKEPQ